MIHLFDCNNWVRRQFEVDPTGLAIRNLFEDAYRSPDPHIYIFDGFNSRAKRKALYPEYKEGRTKGSDNFYLTLNLFKELILHTNKLSLEIREWEADDIIGHIIRTRVPGSRYKIYSTDKDFAPFACDEVIVTCNAIKDTLPEDVRLYKTLVKDTTDNIPGIKKFGDGAWAKLSTQDKLQWKDFLDGKINSYPMTGLTPVSASWTALNIPLLKIWWQIVEFIPMDDSLIAQNLKAGIPNYEVANQKLKALFL
jgi:hypothetical protein